MKYFFVLLFAASAAITMAQITITSSDLPQAGEQWSSYQDQNAGTDFVPTPPGPAQTWDWTNTYDVSDVDGLSWTLPNGLPGASLFPNADLAMLGLYYAVDVTGMYILGYTLTAGQLSGTTHISGGLFLPTPFTMGDGRNYETVSTSILVPGSGSPATKFVSRTDGTFYCDAWGTMHTPAHPAGVQVLRLVETPSGTVDSTFTDDSGTGNGPWIFTSTEEYPGSVSYRFVRNGHPVLVADLQGGGMYASYYAAGLPDGIAANDHVSVTPLVYPVPSASGLVHIQPMNPTCRQLEVVNSMGELLQRIDIHGVEVVNLGTDRFASGAYLFRCVDEHGAVLGQGRFIVQR